eukprot:CAMPEP_0195132140 /NCGR_PEP_ID=MMETSP0448-20130528/146342_1 /TAXON_ID=66468 /ORGANISM="Heterocapsa triquestra, Strain CCMP 448" /LENGTH=45 /DNA_ID= /DNA_START= /DNA_END= /DNA_ORIENTATION=
MWVTNPAAMVRTSLIAAGFSSCSVSPNWFAASWTVGASTGGCTYK